MRTYLVAWLLLSLLGCPPDDDSWGDPNEVDCIAAPHQDRCKTQPDGEPEGDVGVDLG